MTVSDFKSRTRLKLVIHAIILVTTAFTAVTGVLNEIGSHSGDFRAGLMYFQPFTMECNTLAGICAFFIVCCSVRNLRNNKDTTPEWIIIFEYMTAACLFLTIVTVTFFLAPMDAVKGDSFFGMFSNDFFIFHLTNPLLAVFSFVFLEDGYRFRRRDCIWALLPEMVYMLVYSLMVVVFGKWDDFYDFTFGGKTYLILPALIIMLSLSCLLSLLLIRMNGMALAGRDGRAGGRPAV